MPRLTKGAAAVVVERSLESMPAVEVAAPAEQTLPLVFVSPHSGAAYLRELVAQSRLDVNALRRSEDAFVDDLFAAAPSLGAPLLRAVIPRVFVDLNREPWELDPGMFDGPLPPFVNTSSYRVIAGLGTIARIVSSGAEIYRKRLAFAEAERRVRLVYEPFHAAVRDAIAATQARFGCAVLVDCHSMPSIGGPMDHDSGRLRADIVLGDRFGKSCAGTVIGNAERALRDLGYRVHRNNPYAGGYTTQHYGRPADGVHTLQIEINRALYMDEERIARSAGFAALAQNMTAIVAALAELDPAALAPVNKAAE